LNIFSQNLLMTAVLRQHSQDILFLLLSGHIYHETTTTIQQLLVENGLNVKHPQLSPLVPVNQILDEKQQNSTNLKSPSITRKLFRKRQLHYNFLYRPVMVYVQYLGYTRINRMNNVLGRFGFLRENTIKFCIVVSSHCLDS